MPTDPASADWGLPGLDAAATITTWPGTQGAGKVVGDPIDNGILDQYVGIVG